MRSYSSEQLQRTHIVCYNHPTTYTSLLSPLSLFHIRPPDHFLCHRLAFGGQTETVTEFSHRLVPPLFVALGGGRKETANASVVTRQVLVRTSTTSL